MSVNELHIDHSEEFPNLAHAPIVEAVLHWQAMASKDYREAELLREMHDAFPDYTATNQHNLEAGFTGTPEGIEFKQKSAWQGVRLTQKGEKDQDKFICQFLRQGVVFSQLAPYTGWDVFEPEALRFWEKHCELGDPNEVARLTVRFISQIAIASIKEIENYIDTVCEPVYRLGLSASSYYHQDTIELSNHPYVINIVRAVQPTPDGKLNLIVDIAAATSGSFELEQVDDKLKDLRFIKNKVFFTLMKDAAQSFGAIRNAGI
ncbi:MAG: TIGR04255 family protein [Planctomycetales bacterium]|nr:TIGR04255 family protein [Planctomycetales bacterium]